MLSDIDRMYVVTRGRLAQSLCPAIIARVAVLDDLLLGVTHHPPDQFHQTPTAWLYRVLPALVETYAYLSTGVNAGRIQTSTEANMADSVEPVCVHETACVWNFLSAIMSSSIVLDQCVRICRTRELIIHANVCAAAAGITGYCNAGAMAILANRIYVNRITGTMAFSGTTKNIEDVLAFVEHVAAAYTHFNTMPQCPAGIAVPIYIAYHDAVMLKNTLMG